MLCYHTDSDSVIIVEDNGPGFEIMDDSKSHTTLTNIRQRLELMCEGKMEIMPRNAPFLLIPPLEIQGCFRDMGAALLLCLISDITLSLP